MSAWHETPYGRVESGYRVKDDILTYECLVPANTSAELFLPVTGEKKELESGRYEFNIKLR